MIFLFALPIKRIIFKIHYDHFISNSPARYFPNYFLIRWLIDDLIASIMLNQNTDFIPKKIDHSERREQLFILENKLLIFIPFNLHNS